ncbi:MAG: 50S ribosomal protein L17 [Polyangiaceae bacterium]
MRHQNAGRKFDRNTSHRRAMFRNLAANLIAHERIETTEAKAKELRRVVEKLLSKAIRLGKVAFEQPKDLSAADRARRLHAERIVASFLPRFLVLEDGGKPVDLVQKVFLDLAKHFQGRPGGYTRTIKLGPRRGDNAPMVFIELTDRISVAKATPKTDAVAPAAAAEAPKADAPAAAT